MVTVVPTFAQIVYVLHQVELKAQFVHMIVVHRHQTNVHLGTLVNHGEILDIAITTHLLVNRLSQTAQNLQANNNLVLSFSLKAIKP